MGKDDEHVRAMRWLYEDEKSYRKAAAKLKLEELKARKEKELIRQYRKRQRRIWINKADTTLRPLVLKLKKRAKRKQLVSSAVALVILGVIWGGYLIASHNTSNGQVKTLGASTVKLDFKPVVPQDGGQNLTTTENNHHKIVTYQDTFNGTNIIVSQQKLPESFKSDPKAITSLDQFRSAESLDTAKGKLYITTNNTGQQWAAMSYYDVLIFFQTKQRIGFEDWYKYIKTLNVQ